MKIMKMKNLSRIVNAFQFHSLSKSHYDCHDVRLSIVRNVKIFIFKFKEGKLIGRHLRVDQRSKKTNQVTISSFGSGPRWRGRSQFSLPIGKRANFNHQWNPMQSLNFNPSSIRRLSMQTLAPPPPASQLLKKKK